MSATRKKRMLFGLASLMAVGAVVYLRQQRKNKAKNALPHALLWEISGNDLRHPSYLLGTIHLICPDKFLWTDRMQNALERSRKIAFEVNISNPELAEEINSGLQLPAVESLSYYFSPRQYARIVDYAENELGLPESVVSTMQPFAVLSMAMSVNGHCLEPVSYEEKIVDFIAGENKSIIGLETAADQLKMVRDMDMTSIADQLIQLVDYPNRSIRQYRRLLKAFLRQDLEGLLELVLRSPEMKADLQTLLYDRNHNWIPKIENLIKESPTFIAVGAGHLAGKNGLIELLHEKGYNIKPIT